MIKKNDKIYLAGHTGLVGSAIYRRLKKLKYSNIIISNKKNLDLRDQKKVFHFLKKTKPKIIIIAAAKVGGIKANNKYKGEFIYDNLAIQTNLIHGAFINNIKNIIFLGSSCVYPKYAKQPIKEKYLLQGELEKTNEPYAIAKIAGIKLCESYNFQYKTNYKCLMPTNTYGPEDNYDLNTSHFFPAIIKKIYLAQQNKQKFITLWGSGKAKRELIFVDDLAEAIVFFMNKKTKETLINVGSGVEKTIYEFTKFTLKTLNVKLKIKFDKSKPDGTLRKKLDLSILKKYGWKSKISLKNGILTTYKNFILKKN